MTDIPDDGALVTQARKVWPLGGYAPGHYSCKCWDCGCEFTGDKRASNCLECAVVKANARAASPAQVAPDGWKLVPIEPTEAMLKAGQSAADDKRWAWCGYGPRKEGEGLDGMWFYVRGAFAAMLSASPAQVASAPDRAGVEEAAAISLMYLQTGFMACEQCGHEMPTAHLDAAYELGRVVKPVPPNWTPDDTALSATPSREGES